MLMLDLGYENDLIDCLHRTDENHLSYYPRYNFAVLGDSTYLILTASSSASDLRSCFTILVDPNSRHVDVYGIP